MTTDLLVDADGIAKTYGAVRALRGVSVSIARGEIVGICGQNGAGKSTFVKVLTGLEQPEAGTLTVNGKVVEFKSTLDGQRAGIAIVDQELALVPQLSIEENMFLGHREVPLFGGRAERRERCHSILTDLGLGHLDPAAPVRRLRIGEQQLVEIGRGLARDAQLLILDEPSATLSSSEIERVFAAVRRVREQGKSVLYVSHRLGEVLDLCDRVLVFGDGHLRGTHHVGDLDRDRLVRLIIGEAGVVRTGGERSRVDLDGPDPGLVLEGLTVAGRLRRVDLRVPRGAIVGLAGQVGSGADDVVRALGGMHPTARGRANFNGTSVLGSPRKAHRAGVRFVPGDRRGEGLFLNETVAANLTASRLGAVSRLGVVSRRQRRSTATSVATQVAVSPTRLDTAVGNLSGGNQQKTMIGRALGGDAARLVVLDEPTRGVDVAGRGEIHMLLKDAADAGSTVVFASTELDEIFDLADVIVTMSAGEVVAVHHQQDASPDRVLSEMAGAHDKETNHV